MSFSNRIAVVSHRGWASSAIVNALATSQAAVKVLYRSSSDITDLPPNLAKAEVDFDDQACLIAALQDIDIVISLVGHEGVTRQHALIQAIQQTKVQLFSPSDLAARYDQQGLQIPVNKRKQEVEEAAQKAGIPMTVILTGNFIEFALNTRALGVDIDENKLIFVGNSAEKQLNVCTRSYVAAAYVSIFADTPISEIKNRTIGLSELKFTGNEIANILKQKHGREAEVFSHSLEKVDSIVDEGIRTELPFALAWYCRKIWGTGQQVDMVGADIWNVPGYPKANLEDLILGGKLGHYRTMPPAVDEYFRSTFTTDL